MNEIVLHSEKSVRAALMSLPGGVMHFNWYEILGENHLNKVKDFMKIATLRHHVSMVGKSGTTWIIDAVGYRDSNTHILIESKNWADRDISSEMLASFAFRMMDLSSSQGLFICPRGLLQPGAIELAKYSNIQSVHLGYQESTLKSGIVLKDYSEYDSVEKNIKNTFFNGTAEPIPNYVSNVIGIKPRIGYQQVDMGDLG